MSSHLSEDQREGRLFQEEKVQRFKRKWEEKQDQAFTFWVNSYLVPLGFKIDSVLTGLGDGVTLIHFIQALTEKKCTEPFW